MESILQNKASLEDMLFEDVDGCAVHMLHGVAEYQKLRERRGKLSQQNPFINELYDSDGSISLTEEQHRILKEEMELSLAISQYERREYFWIGQQYILEYLEWMKERRICCGQEGEGSSHAAGGTGVAPECTKVGIDNVQICGKEWCEAGDLPDWLDGFIQHLDHLLTEKLEQNPGWLKLKQSEQEILQRHPLILKLIEGNLKKEVISISVEEQEAFEEFFSLQLHMDSYRELELYMIGQRDLVKYFRMLLS